MKITCICDQGTGWPQNIFFKEASSGRRDPLVHIGLVRWSGRDQPAGWSPSRITVHQTSRTVFFSHDKSAGTVFFNQVLDQRTGP